MTAAHLNDLEDLACDVAALIATEHDYDAVATLIISRDTPSAAIVALMVGRRLSITERDAVIAAITDAIRP